MDSTAVPTTTTTPGQQAAIVKAIRAQADGLDRTLDEISKLKGQRKGIPALLAKKVHDAPSIVALRALADRIERGDVHIGEPEVEVNVTTRFDLYDAQRNPVGVLVGEDTDYGENYGVTADYEPFEQVPSEDEGDTVAGGMWDLAAYPSTEGDRHYGDWLKVTAVEQVERALKLNGRIAKEGR